MIHASLFSGIGGAELAADMAGWQTAFHREKEKFCRRILNYYWPHAKTYTDITTADFSVWRNRIDVLSGGFPCQGNSVAGKRLGTDDERYLWPAMRAAYQTIGPDWVVCENVTGLLTVEDKSGIRKEIFPQMESRKITRFADVDHYEAVYTRQSKMLINTICENFEEDGYEAIPFVISAASIGAPHRRDRVWIVANRTNTGIESLQGKENRVHEFGIAADAASKLQQRNECGKCGNKRFQIIQQKNGKSNSNKSRTMVENGVSADTECKRSGQIHNEAEPEFTNGKSIDSFGNEWFAADTEGKQGKRLQFEQQKISEQEQREFGRIDRKNDNIGFDYWRNFPTVEPVICSGDDGLSDRLDGITFSKWRQESIRGYGNAWVPQIGLEIFRIINEVSKQ